MRRFLRPLLWCAVLVGASLCATALVNGQTKADVQNDLAPGYKRIDVAYTSGTFDQVKDLTIGGGTEKLKQMFDSRTAGDQLLTTFEVVKLDRKYAEDKVNSYLAAEVHVSASIKRGNRVVSRLQLTDFWMQDRNDSFKWKIQWRQPR